MSLQDNMDAAHKRDYEDQRKMRELRQAIETFLADPPSRVHTALSDRLRLASGQLKTVEDHITAVWD
jgi:hypothetical protein